LNYPVIILGGGGHAKVLIDALRLNSIEILGLTDSNSAKYGKMFLGIPVLGSDEIIEMHAPESVRLVNGVGTIRDAAHRTRLFERYRHRGYQFANIVHPSAIIAGDVVLSEGVQIMAGAVIQAGCHIGINTIINTQAAVDHDCLLGNHVHISPGVTLCGMVQVGESTHVGSGATVIQGITIGRNSLIAAGSVVIRDVPDATMVAGVPAKKMKLKI